MAPVILVSYLNFVNSFKFYLNYYHEYFSIIHSTIEISIFEEILRLFIIGTVYWKPYVENPGSHYSRQWLFYGGDSTRREPEKRGSCIQKCARQRVNVSARWRIAVRVKTCYDFGLLQSVDNWIVPWQVWIWQCYWLNLARLQSRFLSNFPPPLDLSTMVAMYNFAGVTRANKPGGG